MGNTNEGVKAANMKEVDEDTKEGRVFSRDAMENTSNGVKAANMKKVDRDTIGVDSPEECSVCMSAYDDVVQRPRNLPCGHTFCTSCVNELKDQGHITCPTCRFRHAVPEAGQFPISYITEAFVKRMRGTPSASLPPKVRKDSEDSGPPSLGRSNLKGSQCLSSAIVSMLQEQEEKVLATISSCQDLQWRLNQYGDTLDVWGEQQQDLEDRLQALLDRSKAARVLVRQEETQVTEKKEQVYEGEQQQRAMLKTLRTATNRQEAFEAIDDADHLTGEERRRVGEWREMFPDVQTVTNIRKVRLALRAALKAALAVEAALDTEGTEDAAADGEGDTKDAAGEGEEDASVASSLQVTITGRLQDLLAPTLEAEDLRRMMQPTRSLLKAGRVFATHEVEGQSRYAQITLDDDQLIALEDERLYLHFLKDQTLPPGAAILQVEDLVPAAPPCLAFLDLEWPDKAARRVLLRLYPDTPLGRQFILLCTGQRGPCYANTVFFQVKNSGQPGERVSGGDYERNNGKGGAPLLPDLDKGEYRLSRKAGAVHPVWRGGDKSAWNSRFGILTKDLEEEGVPVNTVFGEVEDGLEVVTEAAEQPYIYEVKVVDCGVVLWQ